MFLPMLCYKRHVQSMSGLSFYELIKSDSKMADMGKWSTLVVRPPPPPAISVIKEDDLLCGQKSIKHDL